jgi:hypothetical protein
MTLDPALEARVAKLEAQAARNPGVGSKRPSSAHGSAIGLTVTIVEHPNCFLMRLEHDGASMTLDRAEALDLREKLSAKLGAMPVKL